jgi:hypothetical protein
MHHSLELALRLSWWLVLLAGILLVTVGPRIALKDGTPDQVECRRKLVRVCGAVMLVCAIGALLLARLR